MGLAGRGRPPSHMRLDLALVVLYFDSGWSPHVLCTSGVPSRMADHSAVSDRCQLEEGLDHEAQPWGLPSQGLATIVREGVSLDLFVELAERLLDRIDIVLALSARGLRRTCQCPRTRGSGPRAYLGRRRVYSVVSRGRP